jgi:hypothetical protein
MIKEIKRKTEREEINQNVIKERKREREDRKRKQRKS